MKFFSLFVLGFSLLSSFAWSKQVIHIATDDSSLVFLAQPGQELALCHYGAFVAGLAGSDAPEQQPEQGVNDCDLVGTIAPAYSAMGGPGFLLPALRITHSDGDLNTELRYLGYEVLPQSDANMTSTVIHLCDSKQALEVDLIYKAYAVENTIVCSAVIRNKEKGPIVLHRYHCPSFAVRASSYLLTQLYGSWASEAQVVHSPLVHGVKSIESTKLVRTTKNANPSFMLSLNTSEFRENEGEVIAGTLAWSGNYQMNFEIDDENTLHVTAGVNPYASEYELKSGQCFTTPEFSFTYSAEGAGGASRHLHDWARRYAVYGASHKVPTLLNSWEGSYFDFTTKTLTDMMDDAANMGLEMFVLDDGWFGNKYPRNDDQSGLGDWEVNEKKLPEGIAYLADYAHSKGLLFGIWLEPEMMNPKSVLAEQHPDWVIQTPEREKGERSKWRQQWVLDLSNPAVQDFLVETIDGVMKLSPNIDYIKWDANRFVVNIGSTYLDAKHQSHLPVDYVHGFYNVLERLRDKYPNLMMQACSSGGGRVDYGTLKYFNEVWGSDSTDPVTRAFIQYGVSLFYPMQIVGSHVSASPSHQGNRITPLKFRFDMAATGRMGMELQPKNMSESEKDFARKAIAQYKRYRDLVMDGDLYRLGSPADATGYALMYVSKDQKRAVLFAFNLEMQRLAVPPATRLLGLDPQVVYGIEELNVDNSRYAFNKKCFTGAFLQNIGLKLYLQGMHQSAVFLLEARP